MTKRQIEAIYSLSPSQQGMLFDTLAGSASGKYIEISIYDLQGKLNLAAFHQAWQSLLARHAALRTGFVWKDQEEPLQFVVKQLELPLIQRDLRGLSPEQQQREIDSYLEDLHRTGFNMAKPPLLQIALFQLQEQTYRFVWSMHHILVDGWCNPIVLKDLMAFYEAHCAGAPLQLAQPPAYQDYIRWLKQQDMGQAQQFWQRYLQGFHQPTPLGMPTEVNIAVDDERSMRAPFAEITGYLSAETTAQLRALAQQNHITLSTLMQATWAILLSHYSGSTDVLFGATVSGRPTAVKQVESMVGLFINTLPIRIQIEPTASVLDWLQTVQRSVATQESYAFCSAGQIHAWSEVSGSLPLFESILVFQNYPSSRSNSHNRSGNLPSRLEATPVPGIGARTAYALTLIVSVAEEVAIRLVYQNARLAEADIERILAHWQHMLRRIVADPRQPISQLFKTIPMDEIPKFYLTPLRSKDQIYLFPRTPQQQKLVAIWEELLGVRPIGIQDNFFALGGHSLSAVQLMAHVQQAFNQRLPINILFQHPTIEALSAQLSQAQDETLWSPLVAIQPRGEKTPFFCVPGAGGNPLYLHPLACYLTSDQPFYGLQAVGLDGVTAPPTTLEATAEHYIAEIKRIQPQGPYFLGGHSYGGWVAFEMAQQLLKQGEAVGLLAILDVGAPDPSHLHARTVDEVEMMLSMADTFSQMTGNPHMLSGSQLQPLSEEDRLCLVREKLVEAHILPAEMSLIQIRGFWNVYRANLNMCYQPQAAQRLPITLFMAQAEVAASEQQQMIDSWSRYGCVVAKQVPGNHLSMLTEPQVQVLAQALTQLLADREKCQSPIAASGG